MGTAKMRNSDYELFGQILQSLRLEQDLTQKQLAEKFRMPQQTYQGYESGARQVTLTLLKMFADYFGVSIDYLAGRTNDRSWNSHLPEKTGANTSGAPATIAAHRSDDPMQDLPQEALDSIEEFKKSMRKIYLKG